MSQRNFTLFIITLILVVAGIFGFLYFYQGQNQQPGEGGGTNFLSRFNPFGQSNPVTPTPEEPIDISEPETPTLEVPQLPSKLTQISSVPVAGYEILMRERLKEMVEVAPSEATPATSSTSKPVAPATELVTSTRYVDRASGNIYQTFLDQVAERRFSTTTIPKVYEAYFGNKNSSVILRYLKTDNKTIQTFQGAVPKEILGADAMENELTGTFLPEGITEMSISPDGSKMFYLVNVGDVSVGTTLNFADNKKTQIFDSPFTEWLVQWPSTNLITLNTKPSAFIEGHMYSLNPTSKSFSRTLGGVLGLTTLTSPSGKSVLYGDSSLSLNILSIDKNTRTPAGVRTLPEKCVWGSDSITLYCAVPVFLEVGQYPDSWYQGEVSFADQIWKIDTVNGTTDLIIDTTLDGKNIDAIKLALDKDNKYILFVNKKDSMLWKLDLE